MHIDIMITDYIYVLNVTMALFALLKYWFRWVFFFKQKCDANLILQDEHPDTHRSATPDGLKAAVSLSRRLVDSHEKTRMHQNDTDLVLLKPWICLMSEDFRFSVYIVTRSISAF